MTKTPRTKTIGGVEFAAVRIQEPRPHWVLQVLKTGRLMTCFTGKTLAQKWDDAENVARLIGPRFAEQTQ